MMLRPLPGVKALNIGLGQLTVGSFATPDDLLARDRICEAASRATGYRTRWLAKRVARPFDQFDRHAVGVGEKRDPHIWHGSAL